MFRLEQRKAYTTTKIFDGSVIGVMLSMDKGQLSFTIDGKNQGIASQDKRLKMGKYFAAVLLLNAEDRVTLVNPRQVQQASIGYERLFSRLNL